MFSKMFICFRPVLGILLVLLAVTTSPAQNTFVWDNGGGTLNWSLGQNWSDPVGGNNNFVPLAFFNEMAVINNGDTVNVTTAQTQLDNGSGGQPAENQSAVGGVTVDTASTLSIQGSGHLGVLVNGGTSGSAFVGGAGTLRVQSGGQLTVAEQIGVFDGTYVVGPGGISSSRFLNSEAASVVTLSGNASVTTSALTSLGGTTNITGPNVIINTGGVVLNGSSVLHTLITNASSHSIIRANGGVALGGTLRPEFSGVTPTLGNSWVLFDANLIGGSFDTIDGTLAPLSAGLRYELVKSNGGVNGVVGSLVVENFLTLQVNRASGEVAIRNKANLGSGVSIDSYQITSPSGTLDATAFTSSLQDDGFGGGAWLEANPNANALTELNSMGFSTVSTSFSNVLGNVYDRTATLQQFGDSVPEDLGFSYRLSDGRIIDGQVEYINNGLENTLLLQVDPTDGKARIINDSTFGLSIDSYRVLSATNSLNTAWDSLDDQNIGGIGVWLEANPTTGALAEVNPLGVFALSPGQTAVQMDNLYNFSSGSQDLQFEFRVPGLGVLSGVVRYESFGTGSLDGDFDLDGDVDGRDFLAWQRGNSPNGTPGGPVSASDLALWQANYGMSQPLTAAFTTVPEPSTAGMLLMVLVVGIASCNSYGRRSDG